MECKLKKEFPEKLFKVELLYDEDVGDCGLTFYQTKCHAYQMHL